MAKKAVKKASKTVKVKKKASSAKRPPASVKKKAVKATRVGKATGTARAKTAKATKRVTGAKATTKTKAGAKAKAVTKAKATTRAKSATRKTAAPKRDVAKKVTVRETRARTANTTTSTPSAPARTERRLTATEIEQFRHMLLEKRAEILGDVSTLHDEALNKNRSDAAGDLSSMPIHMADLGTDNYELEFTLGLIEGERAILKEIDEALERIQQKTYGLCLGTGQPIGKARLRAKPWAKYCYEFTLAQETGQVPR